MIITKKALPRRTILRGMGAALALPLLDAMVPGWQARMLEPLAPSPFMLLEEAVDSGSRGGQS